MLRARSGDTILLSAGKYPFANIGRDHLTIGSLDSQNPAVLIGVKINGVTGTKLEGLTFVSSTGAGNQTSVSNCQIRGFLYGINLHGAELLMEGNTFNENGWAIYIDSNDSSLKIRHNLISKNSGGIWAGGQVEIAGVGIKIITPGSRGLVFNNIVAFNNIGCLDRPQFPGHAGVQ